MEVDERVLLENDGIVDYQEFTLDSGISNESVRVVKAPNLVSNGFIVTSSFQFEFEFEFEFEFQFEFQNFN